MNPTDPIKKISPRFSTIFNAFEEISTGWPFTFWETVSLIWSANKAPYIKAMMKTPAAPKLTPFIVILPNNKPINMHANEENITNDIPWTKITPPKIFISFLFLDIK